jgi:hypothetical protein
MIHTTICPKCKQERKSPFKSEGQWCFWCASGVATPEMAPSEYARAVPATVAPKPHETKAAVCCSCGKPFSHRIPIDAGDVICFECDQKGHSA